jgi:hypothetical protein
MKNPRQYDSSGARTLIARIVVFLVLGLIGLVVVWSLTGQVMYIFDGSIPMKLYRACGRQIVVGAARCVHRCWSVCDLLKYNTQSYQFSSGSRGDHLITSASATVRQLTAQH